MSVLAGVDALARLGGLTAIGLAELNAEAELQTRVDRKYILPLADLPGILADLPDAALVLELGGERALRYESHYFDTPALDSYLGAAQGRRRRFKVRSRSYLDSDASFLEVKTRGGRATTIKDRVPCAVHGSGRLGDAGRAYATEALAAAGIPRAGRIAARLRPRLTTRYRRVTLLLPPTPGRDASRATVDIDLEWIDSAGGGVRLPATVIVETKSGRQSGALDRALWRHAHRPATLSKYGTGLAALHPELPANRWNRVLTRHFRAAEPLAAGPLARTPREAEPILVLPSPSPTHPRPTGHSNGDSHVH